MTIHDIHAKFALMDIQTLTIFVEVAKLKSFAAVARLYNVDPSTISRTIGGLEDELSIRLFQRTTRSLSLSEAGEEYLKTIDPLLQELEQAADLATLKQTLPSGTLRLSTSVAFGHECIIPLLSEFKIHYPNLIMELILSDENLDLVHDRIDLAIRLAPSISDDLIVSKLISTCYKVVCHPDLADSISSPNDLPDQDCLLFNYTDYKNFWRFRHKQEETETEIPVQGRILMSNALSLKQACQNKLGPALLPDWLIDQEISRGKLVNLFPDFDVTATSFDTGAWFVYPSRNYLPAKIRVTIDFIRQHLNK